MEVPSDTQVVSQIKPEELSEIEKNNIDFGSFSIQENELDKLSQHDGSVPSSIASQIDCKMFLQFGDLLKGFFLKLPLQVGGLPPSLQNLTLGTDDIFESSGQQSNASLASQDPFERAEKYLERHNIMQIFQRLTENLIYEQPEDPLYFLLWQIQDIIKERNQS
ncbi:testis-specific expressed protein 55 isoform X1 [Notamacropus eugenii]|uniref:testis-specific expressed protein 55 isoform X1 n=1 Tax=Notamacropus eugenii TaxID=9315 RepID=UPI003B675D3F